MLKLSELHLGVLTALLSIVLLASAWDFPPIPGQPYGSGTLPRLLGYAGILLGLVMIAQSLPSFRDQLAVHRADWTRSGRSVAAALSIVAVIIFYILFSDSIGFMPSAMIVMLVPMLVLRVNPIIAIIVSVVMAFIVRYAFGNLLLVPLPRSPYLPFIG